jgi:hypothetical protein
MRSFVRYSLAVLAAGLAVGLGGCRISSFHVSAYDDDPPPVQRVYLPEGHVCGQHCEDHYYDGARVVVLSGHRHGPGCGHDWDGYRWIVIRKGKVKHVHNQPPVYRVHEVPQKVVTVGHVHSDHCGCAYHPHQKTWIVIENGHRHGPDCGHVFVEGRWTIRF